MKPWRDWFQQYLVAVNKSQLVLGDASCVQTVIAVVAGCGAVLNSGAWDNEGLEALVSSATGILRYVSATLSSTTPGSELAIRLAALASALLKHVIGVVRAAALASGAFLCFTVQH